MRGVIQRTQAVNVADMLALVLGHPNRAADQCERAGEDHEPPLPAWCPQMIGCGVGHKRFGLNTVMGQVGGLGMVEECHCCWLWINAMSSLSKSGSSRWRRAAISCSFDWSRMISSSTGRSLAEGSFFPRPPVPPVSNP